MRLSLEGHGDRAQKHMVTSKGLKLQSYSVMVLVGLLLPLFCGCQLGDNRIYGAYKDNVSSVPNRPPSLDTIANQPAAIAGTLSKARPWGKSSYYSDLWPMDRFRLRLTDMLYSL